MLIERDGRLLEAVTYWQGGEPVKLAYFEINRTVDVAESVKDAQRRLRERNRRKSSGRLRQTDFKSLAR